MGQAVDLGGTGIPLTVDDAADLVSLTMTVNHDSTLLEISDILLARDMPNDWSIESLDLTTPGAARLVASGVTPLPAGPRAKSGIERVRWSESARHWRTAKGDKRQNN